MCDATWRNMARRVLGVMCRKHRDGALLRRRTPGGPMEGHDARSTTDARTPGARTTKACRPGASTTEAHAPGACTTGARRPGACTTEAHAPGGRTTEGHEAKDAQCPPNLSDVPLISGSDA